MNMFLHILSFSFQVLRACEKNLYPDIHFLGRELITIQEVWEPQRFPKDTKSHLLFLDPHKQSRNSITSG